MAGRISYLGGIATQGLVLMLDAAKRDSYPGTGTSWNDISGNQNNGTLVNGPTFNSANFGSIVFDGTNNYVNLGTASLNIVRDITVSFWAKITKNGAIEIFNKGYNIPDYGIFIAKLPTNVLSFQSINVGTVNTNYTVTENITNFTLVRNNTNCSWYINGVLDVSKTVLSGNIVQSNLKEWRIGSNFDEARPFFGGEIYYFLVYNTPLSPQQVLQNYNALKNRFGL